MTDLERIKLIEKNRGIKFRQVKPEDIRRGYRNDCYSLNYNGDVTGLSLHTSQFHLLQEFKELQKITTLTLSGNKLTDVSALKALTNLTTLDLSSNQLTDISVLKALTNLTSLDLSSNQLTDISVLKALTNLTSLDLGNNQLTDVSALETLTKLTMLYLFGNKLTDISALKALTNLTSLYLFGNKLTDISALKMLTNLTTLDLSNNQLTDVSALKTLKKLTTLYLGANQLTDVPALKALTHLTALYLSNNQITDVSALVSVLKELTELTTLSLSGNQLTDVPALKPLTHLTALSLSGNKLTDVSELKELTKLTTLYLSDNQIKSIEAIPDLSALASLQTLRIEHNPVWDNADISLKESENHLSTVRAFQERQKASRKKSITLPKKVLFLGNHAAGKSTLLHYIMTGDIPDQTESTHILEIKPYPAKSKFPEIIFYDFGGQDFYHGIYQVFLSKDAIYLLLYHDGSNKNIKDPDSAGQPIRFFNLEYWLGQKNFFESKPDCPEHDPVLLIRTHADDEHKKSWIDCNPCEHNIQEDFNLSLVKTYGQNISVERQKAYRHGLEYFKISLTALVEEKAIKRKEPQWYIDFLEYIYQQWQSNTQEYVAVDSLRDRFKEGDIKVELEQLHRSGLVFYYKNDPDLEDVVWLNPHAVIEHVHGDILSKKRISEKEGQLTPQDIERINSKLIKLLQNQKVIFRHDPTGNTEDIKYIIPNYLPQASDNQEEYDLLTFGFIKPDFTLRFRHFLPFGLINQIICFFGQQPNKKMFWRDQLLFTLGSKKNTGGNAEPGQAEEVGGEAKVLINLDFNKMEIKVYCAVRAKAQTSSKMIQEYLFFSILSLYWSLELEPPTWEDFIEKPDFRTKNNNKPDLRAKNDGLEENSPEKHEFAEWKSLDALAQWKRLREKEKYRPDDLYISLDTENFIRYKDLFAENAANRINVYRIEKNDHNHMGGNASSQLHLSLFQAFNPNKEINKMKTVFISYSHDDIQARRELQKFLINPEREGLIEIWQDGLIEPGTDWDKAIKARIETADIIIMLISQSFIASNYIYEVELKKALEKASVKEGQNEVRIIPFLLSSCDWQEWKAVNVSETEKNDGKISKFQFMPQHEDDNKLKLLPLNKWEYQEEAWQQLVNFIRKFAKK